MRVGIIGASGYVGGELLRLLLLHPKVEVTVVTSRKYEGEYVHRVHANLRGLTDLQFSEQNLDGIGDKCDLVFTSVPHGTAIKVIPSLIETGVKVVDMSADFRLKNPKDYVKWYGYEHPSPELLEKFVYGVPELHREEIKNASNVAAPGCMAVTSILALAPLVKNHLIDEKHIVVDMKIGSSGAGVKPSLGTIHAERYGVIRPYKPVGHRHTGEIEQELSALSGNQLIVSMSPHAVNMVRGILCTAHVFVDREMTVGELWKTYRGFYVNEPFIRYIRDKKSLYQFPDPKIVIGSNFCDIGFEIDGRASRLVVLSATDNLMKGAAGSGVQCMNVMSSFDERTGLESAALHPL